MIAQVQDLAPHAQELIVTLNDRVVELKDTLSRVNDLLSPQNRANFSAVLADSRGMIQENRPQLKSTLEHLNEASGQLQPVLDDLRKTSAQANQTLDHVDAMIGEDRPDLHQSVLELRQSLATRDDSDRAAQSDGRCEFRKSRRGAGQSSRRHRKPEGNYGHDQGEAVSLDTFEPSA